MARKAVANLVEAAGAGTTITYATSGIDGLPSFRYVDATHDVRAGAEAIGTKEDELGTLVSVDLSVAEVGPTTTATLLVPSANLPEAGEAPLAPWPS